MRKILKIINNVYFTKTPIYVIFFVTSFCNARCKMCFNWQNIDEAKMNNELKFDEIKKIFKKFSSIQQLTISGGEPFLRKDLPEILGFISRNNDVQMITIPTNGILTDIVTSQTERILLTLPKTTHLRISLSIEGIAQEHDKIVQVKGAFSRIKETYSRLQPLLDKYPNLNVDVTICCSAFNKKRMKRLLEYCSFYFKKSSIQLVLARGDSRDIASKKVTAEEYKEILNYHHLLQESRALNNKPFSRLTYALGKTANYQVLKVMKKNKMPNPCYAYSKLIVLQSNGDVLPCEYLGKKLGNLRDFEYDIRKILRKNQKVERFIRGGGCYCTWECALSNNLVCNPYKYPKVLKNYLNCKFKS